jgi:cellulose synthase/poly-beta-1,6-N-acetylglucosamine synthase-like glycosyltransferase
MKMSVIEFNGEVFTKTKMSGSPLVSIILPFLNAEKFIQETIESVLAQTYNSRFAHFFDGFQHLTKI